MVGRRRASSVIYSFQMIFGKSIPEYLVTELAMNQAGAETRLDQIQYGLKEVWRQPVFGIGLNIAKLPFWRSDIFDNFWLHTAVRFGIPAFLFIAGAFALHFLYVTLRADEQPGGGTLRIGYAIPFVTLVLLIGSIAVWGSVVVFIMAYLGAGAWFYNGRPGRGGPAAAVGRPSRRRGGRPRRPPLPPGEPAGPARAPRPGRGVAPGRSGALRRLVRTRATRGNALI